MENKNRGMLPMYIAASYEEKTSEQLERLPEELRPFVVSSTPDKTTVVVAGTWGQSGTLWVSIDMIPERPRPMILCIENDPTMKVIDIESLVPAYLEERGSAEPAIEMLRDKDYLEALQKGHVEGLF